jgi:hypothetical protein
MGTNLSPQHDILLEIDPGPSVCEDGVLDKSDKQGGEFPFRILKVLFCFTRDHAAPGRSQDIQLAIKR